MLRSWTFLCGCMVCYTPPSGLSYTQLRTQFALRNSGKKFSCNNGKCLSTRRSIKRHASLNAICRNVLGLVLGYRCGRSSTPMHLYIYPIMVNQFKCPHPYKRARQSDGNDGINRMYAYLHENASNDAKCIHAWQAGLCTLLNTY